MEDDMQTNMARIKDDIKRLAEFSDTPGQGVSRFSFGDQDKKAREYLLSLFSGLGLAVRVDAVGNIFARLEGSEPSLPVLMSGSHIDSVKNGGKFDGIVGCVCAIEVVRVLKENNYQPKHPIEIVIFAEEEGSNFKVPVLGSKVLAGKLDKSDLEKAVSEAGVSAYDVIKNAGYHPENISGCVLKKDSIKAMLEVHIEQSVRLDMEGHTIGIVSGIAGLNWLEITIQGVSNHAGATPMHLRNDALCAAAKIIAGVGDIARKTSPTAVATVGRVEVQPNIPNAIPKLARFTVDIRDIDQSCIDKITGEVAETAEKAAKDNGVTCKIEKLATSKPIFIPDYLIATLEENAKKLGLDYILMPSGAVHDSNYMAEVTDVCMIFVPSIDGRSHVPEENTRYEDIKAGADLLLATLIGLSGAG